MSFSSSAVPTPSSSDSGSQSPISPSNSGVSSNNPSPATHSLMLSNVSPDSDPQSSSHSARGTPSRAPSDLLRSHSGSLGGKGGCWTCRLRRKKCDEQRVGDSCQTCIRLKIDCLGWGSKRPDWMRDKQAVEAYKAGIKAKLTSAGMIRGQPRTPVGGMPSAFPIPSSSQLRHQHQHQQQQQQHLFQLPGVIGPGPSMLADAESGPFDYFGGDPSQQRDQFHYPAPFRGNVSGSSGTAHNLHMPITGYADSSQHPSSSHYSPQTPRSSMSSSVFRPEDFPVRAPAPDADPAPSSDSQPQGQSSVVEQHVFYYFQSVLPVQYIFAANSLTSVLHDVIVQEPLGAVTNAGCALASLHNKSIRVARGLEPPDAHPEHSTANAFYERAFWQLANSRVLHDQYSEADAIAALHLIGYWVFSGGTGDWPVALDVAREWLNQTGLTRGENPKMTIRTLSDGSKFAAKATMWFDIFASITFTQPPRFLSLYRRVFGGGGGFWAQGQFDLRMDLLMGCTDNVLLALAEITALAQWKAQERGNGSLSVRELVRRGDAIEELLRRRQEPQPPSELDQPAGDAAGLLAAAVVPSQSQSPRSATPSSSVQPSPTPTRTHPTLPAPSAEVRRLVSDVFRETAILYLHTVLSDHSPGVPEIVTAVGAVVQAVHNLPPTIADRSLVFPMFLAGCMTDQPNQREMIKRRLSAQDETIGNIRNARLLMEAVWNRRDTQGGVVDWRDVMHDMGLNLLLV